MTREEVSIQLGIDQSQIGGALNSVKAKFGEFAGELRGSIQKVGKDFLGAFSAGAISAKIMQVINHFDDLQDRAENLEISTDFLQGITHIASKDTVGGIQGMNKAIEQLAVNLGQARNGTKAAVDKFAEWGIKMSDIAGMDTEGVFYEIADRIKDIPDPAQKAAMAFDLLGKSGKGMAGFLSQGGDSIKRLVAEVDKLDAEKVKALAATKDQLVDMENTVTIWTGKVLGGWAEFWKDLGRIASGDPFGAFAEEAQIAIEKEKQLKLDEEIGEAEQLRIINMEAEARLIEENKAAKKEEAAMIRRYNAERRQFNAEQREHMKAENVLIKDQERIRKELIKTFWPDATKPKPMMSDRSKEIAEQYEDVSRELTTAEEISSGIYGNEFTRSNLRILRGQKALLRERLEQSLKGDIGGEKKDYAHSNMLNTVSAIMAKLAPKGAVAVKVLDEETP